MVEPCWGNGYATEALRALLAHLQGDPGVRRVVAETLVGHAASVSERDRPGALVERYSAAAGTGRRGAPTAWRWRTASA